MIDCDKLIERKDLTKVVKRKKGVEREKGQNGRKMGGVKTFSLLARPLTSAYAYQCGLGVLPLHYDFQWDYWL